MSHSTKFNRPKKDSSKSWSEPILTTYPQVVPSKSRSPAFNSGVDRISQFQLFRYFSLLGQRMVMFYLLQDGCTSWCHPACWVQSAMADRHHAFEMADCSWVAQNEQAAIHRTAQHWFSPYDRTVMISSEKKMKDLPSGRQTWRLKSPCLMEKPSTKCQKGFKPIGIYMHVSVQHRGFSCSSQLNFWISTPWSPGKAMDAECVVPCHL